MKETIFTINQKEDSKTIEVFKSILQQGFKKHGKFKPKVHYFDTIYNLSIKGKPKRSHDGEFGRDKLVDDILKVVPVKRIEDNQHLLMKDVKEFLLSLKSKDVKNKDFQNTAHLFSEKFSRGCLNLFRYYMINHHTRSRDETKMPLVWKDREIDLTCKQTQASIYKSFIRGCENPLGLRLSLGFSEAYRYDSIEFDHWLNLVKWNYKNLCQQDKKLDVEYMQDLKVQGILKITKDFTLFLYKKNVRIFPFSWMCVPSSQTYGTYHLHRSISDKGFQAFLKANWNQKDFHKALKYGLILDPWKFIASQWKSWKSKGEKDDSFKWDFIRDVDVIIDRFNLTPIN